MARILSVAAVAALAQLALVSGLDNGKAITPPMGFRNWNQWQSNINQVIMEQIMNAMVDRSRTVNGVPTSLADLGYSDVGLDDYWQECGAGTGGYTYHLNTTGAPVINTSRFPSMLNMTSYGHALNLTVGWYGNNCGCADHCSEELCYQGDVAAMVSFNYDSIKLDGCGAEYDLQLWSDLINATSPKSILIENCHWGETLPNATWCPWNYYRSSTDARPTFGSVMNNLQTVFGLAKQNLSTPGCWAYPDMLEAGVTNTQSSYPPLSYVESRTNFGAWSIVSSPLIIGLNVTDGPTMDAVWDILSNTELIAVNQAYVGNSGSAFQVSNTTVEFNPCTWGSGTCSSPSWVYLYKPLPGGATAVMLLNAAPTTQSLTVQFSAVPGMSGTATYTARDVYAHADLGTVSGSWTAVGLTPHDSAFIVLTPA
jgi:alpha-galactosidase